ncbi:MAG: PIN domain-containing protein [Puniceicoccaceae bacterium]|nr:MAG: PIN domain-containing protein [Puniceicoccaceae bacterium]
MNLLDVNVLVYAHREDAHRHNEYRLWLETSMQEAQGVAVSDLVLSGCLRIITHPKIFKEPTPLSLALEFIEDFRSRPGVCILMPGPKHWEIYLELCRRAEASGNFAADAFHAALAVETGCTLVTCDRGFGRFPGLKWAHPLD